MNYYFKGDKQDLQDITTDPVIKKLIITKIRWYDMLLIQLSAKSKQEHKSYIILKYGDMLVDFSSMVPDRTPVMFKDYMPKKLPKQEVLDSKNK